MRLWVFVALAGCNAIFGNDSVRAAPNVDAQFFDAPIDAQPMCPAGTPAFRDNLYEISSATYCGDMSVAETGAILATCLIDDAQQATGLFEGTLDGVAPAQTDLQASMHLAAPVRIAPEGDFALIGVANDGVHGFRRDPATHVWHDLGRQTQLSGYAYLSTLSRGPQYHLIATTGTGFTELVGDGTTWTIQAMSTPDGFDGVIDQMGLTPDGLRLVTVARTSLDGVPLPRYGTRPDLTSAFSTSSPLAEPSDIQSIELSEDCGHLFFRGLDRILYVKQ